MSPEPEKAKKAPRKHVTTACVPCRESKIRCDGSTPNCQNCERKGKECKYQHGDDKRKVSLRAATELFSARIDQLTQFIYDQGLQPPLMQPDDEAAVNRVLETLEIPRAVIKANPPARVVPRNESFTQPKGASELHTAHLPPPEARGNQPEDQLQFSLTGNLTEGTASPEEGQLPSIAPWSPFGMVHGVPANQSFVHWGFTLPTAESLDTIYANMNQAGPPVQTEQSSTNHQRTVPQNSQTIPNSIPHDRDHESDSEEENEAENDVIEQLSHRIGTLKLAGDGHLRFYGATSNLNLVDVSATQQRQRPDARTVRHDGQDILNHLRVGQTVDQALEDHLIELYFTWHNPSIYVVDKEMYMTARHKWRNEYEDTPFYSEVLTNAMCAIGSAFEARYHPTFITFPKSLAEFFADRAKALLEIELDSPCVATVQALVLMSSHEGASNRDARGWLYSGMSMRLTFDLGLHLDMTSYVKQGDMSAHEADVRRAAFWGSYIADHFWGFYLGRPFRMNAGDVSVPKPASTLGAEKQSIWQPYGLQHGLSVAGQGLQNPSELINRQFVVLWEMVSPVGHILYGCSDISRHDLQRITFQVTEDLFAWKANLPYMLQVDLMDDSTPRLPHLLMLHMQYHQIIIFFHRPWVSKNYIQPRSPRQGPGYHHARRMCIESATAVARLLHIYEKHYTFRRMNNQVVAIIFSAALMLLFVTVSSSSLTPTKPGESSSIHPGNAEMVAYLNLCFRALDELGQSFENAKRTRDYLVTLQRRWQAHMRRAGSAAKRQISSSNLSNLSGDQASMYALSSHDAARKKTRVVDRSVQHLQSLDASFPSAAGGGLAFPSTHQYVNGTHQPLQQGSYPMGQGIQADEQVDWICSADVNVMCDPSGTESPQPTLDSLSQAQFHEYSNMLPDLGDIEGWWSPPHGTPGR
ncbi:Nitrogen assimilation transcription factor [Penicillium ucsense]|uniref:Nitrogen assimilation transcription factor n=1 Tax=Penicillium ucsense TaxID=2839758 RepID=A0A8J8W7Q6_9EURO|nr:Nitrogen assimilation transcription factor [Penicillium ucsense]KAF7737222.1 Nitrogen assimilation transcription factor [Penicillium ucsense]